MTTVRAALHLAQARPPLTPERDQARRWAIEELSRPEYRRSLVARVLSWTGDQLDRLLGWLPDLPGGALGRWVLFAALGALLSIVGYALYRTRSFQLPARWRGRPVFDPASPLTAQQHRELARRLAERGDLSGAVLELFRAIARELDESGVLTVHPGRTAQELATAAAEARPALAAELAWAAGRFDDVCYGHRAGTAADLERLQALDRAVIRDAARTPVGVTPAGVR